MTNRKILYGYQIVHGDLVIQEEERLTVQNVFTTYLAGLSYQALADRMNADNIPFSQESPLWNKHKIKRMLENPRYAGENGYPSIIDQDTFQQVQNKIAEKTSGKLPRRTESDGLWQKLRSGCCQTRLLRTGGPIGHTGNVHLKCSACRNAFVVGKEELLAQTARQLAAHETPVCKPYAPSAEAVRLANAINRVLDSQETVGRLSPASCKGQPPDMPAVMMVWIRLEVEHSPTKSIGIASNERSPIS